MIKPNTKFLVVDDSGTARKVVIKVLNDMGLQNITEATNGRQAYELLVESFAAKDPFEFIISDWNMPDVTGIDFLRRCRLEKAYKELPFILITAEGDSNQIFEAKVAGVTDYLVKPFNAENLKAKINHFLDKPEKIDFKSAGLIKKRFS